MRYDNDFMAPTRSPFSEAEIEGKKVPYDGCSSRTLKEAKEFYKGWEYLGSGDRTYHDGVENNWKELTHFFKKPSK